MVFVPQENCCVSIILPVYNARRYLLQALQSLSKQSYTRFEILAIDDGSSDGSLKLLHAYAKKEQRLKVFTQQHGGIVKALNYGINQAQGQYIARMDADDIAFPQRLEKQVQFLEAHPSVVAVGAWVRFIDSLGFPIFTYRMPIESSQIEEELWQGNGGALIHPVILFRKSAIICAGAYREVYRSLEDLDLYLRLLDFGLLANIPEVLLFYRQHLGSVNFSSAHTKRQKLHEMLMQEHCARKFKALPLLNKEAIHEKKPSEIYWQWADWALSEKFHMSAIKFTLVALLRAPLQRKSWSFLKYLLVKLCNECMLKK